MKILIRFFFLLLILIRPGLAQEVKGVPGDLLTQMTRAINSGQYLNMHGILIAKGDQLVYEQYFNGFKKDSLHDSRSSFKSVTSLLVGIALDQGLIKSVDQKVYDFFPEYRDFSGKNSLKKLMTIRDLLEMRSGLDCEEFNGTKDCESEMSASKDWVKFSLSLPMKNKPGTAWSYNSSDPVILGGIISRVAHMPVMDFAKKYLFQPLGISNYKWTVDPAGNGMTGGSFYIRPADMLKIGQLLQNKGSWKGKQLISEKWIALSTACEISIPDFSFVSSARTSSASPQPARYGFYWYRELLKADGFQQELLFASGNGGQYIFDIKGMNLTVVFTQGNYNSFRAKQAFELLAKYIIPAYKK